MIKVSTYRKVGAMRAAYFKDSNGVYHYSLEQLARNGNIVSMGHGVAETEGLAKQALDSLLASRAVIS